MWDGHGRDSDPERLGKAIFRRRTARPFLLFRRLGGRGRLATGTFLKNPRGKFGSLGIPGEQRPGRFHRAPAVWNTPWKLGDRTDRRDLTAGFSALATCGPGTCSREGVGGKS